VIIPVDSRALPSIAAGEVVSTLVLSPMGIVGFLAVGGESAIGFQGSVIRTLIAQTVGCFVRVTRSIVPYVQINLSDVA
jgi:hypothetical protein